MSACGGLQPAHLITLLRSIKHLSTSTSILDVLQNVNAIEILAEILGAYKSGPHSTEICNHVSEAYLFARILVRALTDTIAHHRPPRPGSPNAL